ncbi:MAG: lipoate--protein ligase family protein [Promethearchaeota archaeon]
MHGRIIDQINELNPVRFNLALDEAIMNCMTRKAEGVAIRFWRNSPSVIVGRNQSISKEVNVTYCLAKNIVIARRITGGGTVYHDAGNYNFSFFVSKSFFTKKTNIHSVQETNLFFSEIIVRSLEALKYRGLEIKDFTSIFWNGRKVSGAAAYHSGKMILHHATLLVHSNLKNLESAILASTACYDPKQVKTCSKYSPTINLDGLNVLEWRDVVIKIVENIFDIHLRFQALLEEEICLAKRLLKEKYDKLEWVFQK